MNEKRYKEAFRAVTPSEEAVERIYEITSDKKKFSYKKVIKRVAAAAMAFAIATGIGFGADFMIDSNYEPNTSITNNSSDSKLGVLVAYADEKGFIEIKNINERNLFYRIYVSDYSNKEKTEQIKKEFESEKTKVFKEFSNNTEIGGILSYSETIIFQTNNPDDLNEIGSVRTCRAGEIYLDLDDFTNVKDITFENNSKYAELELCYLTDDKNNHSELFPTKFSTGNKFSVTGKELQYSLDSGALSFGIDKVLNRGYRFEWILTESFYEELQKDLNFDLTKIKDTITFTVNYLDGKTEYATVDISFDKDGYMYLSDKSLTK